MSYGQHSTRNASLAVATALALVVSMPAAAQDDVAQGYSIDIEFLRPSFGHDSFSGVDVPRGHRNLTVRAGTLLQYQQSPLTLYQAVTNEEISSVVTNRFSGMLGASIDIDRVTFGVLVPTALNWGSESPDLAADGFGVGDIGATGRVTVIRSKNDAFNAGLRAGIILPTGRPDSYMGENDLRFSAGALAALNLGNTITLATDLGVLTRPTCDEADPTCDLFTNEDFRAGTEVTWGNGLRVYLPQATRTSINGQILARSGVQDFLAGGAETSLEAIAGLDFYPSKRVTIGVAAGRGLTEGYGTTDLRLLGNLIVEFAPPEDPPPVYTAEAPPPPNPEEVVEIPVVEFTEEVIAVKTNDTIEIRDMLEFFVDTNNLKPESRPTLEAVAKLINDSPEIGHLIIEGHASQEGEFGDNYVLAESRARRIWELLLEEGVAGDRISYRGQGEVKPKIGIVGDESLTEEQLQENRRVEFKIALQYEPDEIPRYPETQYLPWNGRTVAVVQPSLPVVEEDDSGEFDEFDDVNLDGDEGDDTGDGQ